MCGFVGYLSEDASQFSENVLKNMAQAIISRGPDDYGYFHNNQFGLGLAHRRLAIVDLSSAGHQPMLSSAGRYLIVFNGEIYNHQELRLQLNQLMPKIIWCGHSDTETLLAAFECWGIRQTLEKCVGMFAFAVWDNQEKQLTLGRDRLGEKPLYYGWQGKTFLFGSELKGLKAHPAFNADISRDALGLFLRYNYIPAPYSIYQNMSKLMPGCILTISLQQKEPQIEEYWSVKSVMDYGISQPFTGSYRQAVNHLEQLINQSIHQQMIADVPVGAFLSGGVDSSTIVALMQAQSSRPVKTFTIGFHEKGYNEAEFAAQVARHLGTDHTELYLTGKQAQDVIPLLPNIYCEPFADSSQIPTFLVSQLARQHVTVSLSGDAGDELFAGYGRYALTDRIWQRIVKKPALLRHLVAKGITSISPEGWRLLLSPFKPFLPAKLASANIGDKLHKGAAILNCDDLISLYQKMISYWQSPEDVVLNCKPLVTPLTNSRQLINTQNAQQLMMSIDMQCYLPDDILCKVDRAAMAVSLETRVPLLDHNIIEFAWSLPFSYKVQQGQAKSPLKDILYRYVPQNLIDRPKMGFGIPLEQWLRTDMRDWAESLLNEQLLKQQGYFDYVKVRQKWQQHLSGKHNWASQLWSILMFQSWLIYNQGN